MAQNSKIEWTHHTFNPWRGCTKVSPGCANCYAEKQSKRNPAVLGVWVDHGARVVASDSYWREPLKWNAAAEQAGERHRVFCASMADVFEDRPELVEPRERLFDLIYRTKSLNWLLLTKRPANISRLVGATINEFHADGIFDNVWLGTSVENQATADERIPLLAEIRGPVKFLSVEPLLGPVDLSTWCTRRSGTICFSTMPEYTVGSGFDLIPSVDWVIVGGESGPKARPMRPDWARSIRDQCVSNNVSFFFKQWGEWIPRMQLTVHQRSNAQDSAEANAIPIPGDQMWRVGKKAAGRILDGRTWDEFPSPLVESTQ